MATELVQLLLLLNHYTFYMLIKFDNYLFSGVWLATMIDKNYISKFQPIGLFVFGGVVFYDK